MSKTIVKDQDLARRIVAEHVQWAGTVADSLLPAQDQAEIARLRRVITGRNADRPLSVGVFGQFSSGKSTLLNALFGAGLLPSAARVTTSVATRLWPAKSDSLRVTLRRGDQVLEFGTDAFGAWYQSVADQAQPLGIRGALRGIMRSPRAAKDLAQIDVGLAGTILGPGVMVTDTPGFDATDTGHREVAQRVADEVDLAIVLIPASEPGSMSLATFLDEVLEDLKGRCAFVFTKFRQIPADQRAELQEHLVSWLDQHGIPGAPVIRADATDLAVAARDRAGGAADDRAAGAADDRAADDSEISAEAAIAETKDIARQLRALAGDRRQQLIEATLEVLLGKLMTGVTGAVQERRSELEQARARLGEVPIVDLADFLEQWRGEVGRKLARRARRSVADARTAAGPDYALERACDEAVAAVGSRNDVKAIAAELISETEDILDGWMRQALRRAAESLGEDLASEAGQLRQTFTDQYAALAKLTGADPRPPEFEQGPAAIGMPYVDLSGALARLRDEGEHLQSVAIAKNLGGAAAGAAFGTMIFPGVGTVIGGALGWLAGASSRSKQQEQFRSSAQAMQSDSLTAARDAIDEAGPDLREVADTAVDLLICRYLESAGPVVARLTDDYQARCAKLDANLGKVLLVLAEAESRQAALAEHGLRRG